MPHFQTTFGISVLKCGIAQFCSEKIGSNKLTLGARMLGRVELEFTYCRATLITRLDKIDRDSSAIIECRTYNIESLI